MERPTGIFDAILVSLQSMQLHVSNALYTRYRYERRRKKKEGKKRRKEEEEEKIPPSIKPLASINLEERRVVCLIGM